MKIAGRTVPLRIHAILDDHSRYIVAIAATTTEREVEMLSLLVKAMRVTRRRPEALYLDNGATYSGEMLATACSRLSSGLLHATPYDPQARGKMERFWRTLAFLGEHYHVASYASLMGKCPSEVYETAPRYDESIDDAALGAALMVHARRRVHRDGTLEIGGARASAIW